MLFVFYNLESATKPVKAGPRCNRKKQCEGRMSGTRVTLRQLARDWPAQPLAPTRCQVSCSGVFCSRCDNTHLFLVGIARAPLFSQTWI